MSTQGEQPFDAMVVLYTPDEALKRARPLPRREEFVVTGLSDEEWDAFEAALAEV